MLDTSLIFGCLWVLGGAATALLPMDRQQWPGGFLFFSAPLLIVWIGWQNGWIWTVLGLFAFVSMFRRFMSYLAKRALGLPAELPPELRADYRKEKTQ